MDPKGLFDSDDIDWLEKPDHLVESTWVERKRWIDARKLAEQVSAFANRHSPGGLIVIGVTTDGQIVGVEDKAAEELVRELGNHVEGQLERDWRYRFVSAEGRSRLLYVYVPSSAERVLCLSDGSAFRRVGASTSRLSPEQIVDLRDSRGERRFELKPMGPFSEADLDSDVAEKFMAGIVSRNPLTMPLTLQAALENKKLIVPSENSPALSVAGVIVMASTPTDSIPGARLRFLAFDGAVEKFGTERNVVRDRWFDGSLPKIVDDFHDFMGTQVRTFEHLGPGGTFVREPEYPEGAWQEAVVNALVHRSYTLQNAWVIVRMFDDRLEVESPGGYPGGNHPDAEGVFPRPYPRNPNIARALQYLNLAWLAREGTRRMHDEMKKLNLPVPEFRDEGGTKVVVTLRNDWDRRRTRTGEDLGSQWRKIETLLSDTYAIVRWQGLQSWRGLVSKDAIPPSSLVIAAIQMLKRAEIEVSVDQKREVLDLLRQLPDGVLQEPLVRFARDLLPSGLSLGRTDLDQQFTGLISRFDDALDTALSYLESQGLDLLEDGILPATALDNIFLLLSNRVGRPPLPPREWLGRVVAVSTRSKSPVAASVYRTITGRDLVR
jgi:ATP-dependent DNA helicase RecG